MVPTATAPGVLLVTDWAVDPHAVVAAASARANEGPTTFRLVVPAWLHGLDWAGDPLASVPCARRQVARVGELCAAAGLTFTTAGVGDPDPVTAVVDAIHDWGAEQVLLCSHGRHSMASRIRNATGLPVQQVDVPRAHNGRRSGHCVAHAA